MRYAELHCKSNFSFLEGASHADELAARAAELGYSALAVTDRHSLAGIVRAHIAAKEIGLKLLIGAEVYPTDGPAMVLWVTNRAAYGRLARLLTVGCRRAEKGQCLLTLADIADHAEGLIAGIRGDEVQGSATSNFELGTLNFSGAYLLAELHRGPDDGAELARLVALSEATRLPLVAAGDVHYHAAARQPLHEVLTAMRLGTTVERLEAGRFPNAQRHLRPVEEIVAAFAAAPEALRRTLEIAEQCTFSLDELRYEYPEELAAEGFTPSEFLTYLAWKGARKRYPSGVPPKVRGLIEHELALIGQLRYEAYFLTVWDLVRFARSRGILCQGRGSAANSAVCYCLGVTSVDPERADLLFERFISPERNEAPDIDVDFEHERREEVLQYIYDKYGRERSGMTGVVITYRTRSAIRDVGKALGLSLDRVDALAKHVEGRELDRGFHLPAKTDKHEDPQPVRSQPAKMPPAQSPPAKPLTPRELLARRCAEVGIDPETPLGQRLVHLVCELVGFPRHLSQHVGGMVITQGPLCELAPLENAAMPGRTVIQWDKDDLDELGILKVDCLALGMLTAIRKCFDLVERHHGRKLTLATVPAEDPRVYDMICRADTIGVFQIESRAQMSMLPRLAPRCFYDLVIEVAIVRPGPIQGNMVHPYLRRRSGLEEMPPYPTPEIEAVLHRTLGVPLFQEQAMRLAVVAAGFTPGEADQLRRAMGAWRRPGIIDQFHRKLIEGMLARGLSEEFAERVFQQIRGFGEYGFPESHAASFALLVYVSAWLKHYYPAPFCAAIINSQPMGFYAPAQLIRDARQHDVAVLPVDVNASHWDCTLEPAGLRLGFRLLGGLSAEVAERIVAARQARPFVSLDQFTRRTGLGQAVLARLAEGDVFGSLRLDRRAALWDALKQDRQPRHQPLLAGLADDEPAAALPPLPLIEQVFADYRTTGLSLKAHPLSFLRPRLDELHVTPASHLPRVAHGRHLRVAGLVLLRQRPGTARGITFVTLEDETGLANLVIKPEVWERCYTIARRSPAWIAHGRLERKESVIHLVVSRIDDLSASLGALRTASRDFR
ncbi:MAG: DNA polymerase III subunit alpha [Pirellulaceae bacterium]|nr:DNA polymerase III subunit alpha [Pirellulaceae bacterium]